MNKTPKIELHCHLDGSLRVETVIELAEETNLDLPTTDEVGLKSFLVAPMDCPSLAEYLERFDLPIVVMQTEKALERVAFELMEDCAKENVKYIEIRFAPLFHQKRGLSVKQVLEAVLKGIKRGETRYDIKGNLILSFLKFMPEETIYPVLDIGKDYIGKGIVAVDLAGNEEKGFANKYVESMAYAKSLGYRITIHAGETGFGQNVLEAVELLKAERIGHGINIRDHKLAFDKVKSLGLALEVCPTSNVQTKAVKNVEDHPIKDFIDQGILVTLNTDNRTVSDTTMSHEMDLCRRRLNLTCDDFNKIYESSVQASFASENTKKWLRTFI